MLLNNNVVDGGLIFRSLKFNNLHRIITEKYMPESKLSVVMVSMLLPLLVVAEDKKLLPKEVQEFIEKRDGCDHFRGEPAYNEQRRKDLIAQMKALCTGTDKALAKLKIKYKQNVHIHKVLSKYDPNIE